MESRFNAKKKAGKMFSDNNQCDRKVLISRVQQMEYYYDEILRSSGELNKTTFRSAFIKMMIQELCEYMESGMWLHDYECDERGELPADLKRGVLSEDGLYNLLAEVDNNKGN